MLTVSITIAAKNEEKNIEKSLSSALNQSYEPIEIFLIDDTSTDKTAEVAERCYATICRGMTPRPRVHTPNFTIIKNEKNVGFGGSHNVGMRRASGDFVLCLNADCELDRDYVKYAVEVFEKDKTVGAVQGKLLNRRTGKIDTTGLLIFENRRVVNRGQGELDNGQYENPEEVWGVDGAAPVYRRAMLEDIKIPRMGKGQATSDGGDYEYFDQDFFAYKEDIDLSWRMRLAGWKCVYQPKAVAYHDRSAGEGVAKNPLQIIQARKKVSEFARVHSFVNQRLMLIKNETPLLFFKYSPKIIAKEFAALTYVLLFEGYGLRATKEFFRLLPGAIRKRRFVMEKRRIKDRDTEKWLK